VPPLPPFKGQGGSAPVMHPLSGVPAYSRRCSVKTSKALFSETGCGNPGIPYLEVDRRFDFGTHLEYSCVEGFDMSGDTFAECLENGTWSIPTPECKSG